MKKIRRVLVVHYTKYGNTLSAVRRILNKNKITAQYVKRENEAAIKRNVKNSDAVIVVGGDGTLLRVSHFVDNTPVLHVSAGMRKHEAFFAKATTSDFENKLKLLAKGKYKLLPLMRLEAALNGRKLPFMALNEIYVGIKESYHVVKYKLIIGGRSEDQKSSGIIISTPAGSYAWARSAGGRLLPLTAKKIEYVVREPYVGRLTKPKMTKGILGGHQTIEIISKIWDKHEGIVVIDSYKKEFEFNNGSKLVVKAAKQPLNLIYF